VQGERALHRRLKNSAAPLHNLAWCIATINRIRLLSPHLSLVGLQISKSLLGDDQRLRLPRFMEEENKDPEQTKQDLVDKIAKLNASIDEVGVCMRLCMRVRVCVMPYG